MLRNALTILASVLLTQVTACGARAQDLATMLAAHKLKPRIYALVIGVTDYGGNSGKASKAASGAEQFAKVVEATYGTEAVRHLLIDKKATASGVHKALKEIRKLSPGSLVIIYFAGHGVREEFAGGPVLNLRLYGSTATDYDDTSVEAHELWECLTYTKQTNAMIFLDCCYAGSDQPDIVAQSRLNNADIRAFLMCACSRDEQATGDIFTNSLLEIWKSARTSKSGCMYLDEFEEKVKQLVRERDHGFMTPGIAFKTKISRCITTMDKPSSLLMVTFPNGCRTGVDILINKKAVETGFQYQKDGFYICQVSYTEPLVVEVRGPREEVLAGPSEFVPKKMRERIIEFEVKVRKELASSDVSANQFASNAYARAAEAIESYGANPSGSYQLAARKLNEADRRADTSWARSKAYYYSPNDPLLAYAAGAKPLGDDVIADYASKPGETMLVAKRLESLGAYRAAGKLCLDVGKRMGIDPEMGLNEGDVYPSSRDDLLIRAKGDLRIADLAESAQPRVPVDEIPADKLSTTQKYALKLVKQAAPGALLDVWHDLPTSDYDWQYLTAGSSPAQRDKVFTALASVGFDTASVTKELAAMPMAEWPARIYLVAALQQRLDQNPPVVADGTLKLQPMTIAGYYTAMKKYVVEYQLDEKVAISSPSQYEAECAAASKPGFRTKMDMNTIYVSPTGEHAGYFAPAIKVPGPYGREIVAKDVPTAVRYAATKPRFVSRYLNGRNYIWPENAGTFENQKFDHAEQAKLGSIGWTNVFASQQVAAEYNSIPLFPKLNSTEID
jgi:hypothetical protein